MNRLCERDRQDPGCNLDLGKKMTLIGEAEYSIEVADENRENQFCMGLQPLYVGYDLYSLAVLRNSIPLY
jgi:hypothetical protein